MSNQNSKVSQFIVVDSDNGNNAFGAAGRSMDFFNRRFDPSNDSLVSLLTKPIGLSLFTDEQQFTIHQGTKWERGTHRRCDYLTSIIDEALLIVMKNTPEEIMNSREYSLNDCRSDRSSSFTNQAENDTSLLSTEWESVVAHTSLSQPRIRTTNESSNDSNPRMHDVTTISKQ